MTKYEPKTDAQRRRQIYEADILKVGDYVRVSGNKVIKVNQP